MAPAGFGCWCCVTTRTERSPIPDMCRACFDDAGEHAARDAYREAVRNGDAPGGCAECGELDCVCAELHAENAPREESCTFCGRPSAWRTCDWDVCSGVGCNRRASAGPHAATPWWEGFAYPYVPAE